MPSLGRVGSRVLVTTGTRVPNRPRLTPVTPSQVHTGDMRAVRRWLDDPHLLRRVTYGVAIVATALSMFVSVTVGTESEWVVLVVPAVAVAALPSQRLRSLVLALGAGFGALWMPGTVYLWPAVSAMILVSIVEDLGELPLAGWIAGFAGSIGSLFLFPTQATAAPFLAVVLGGSLGLLLRSRFTKAELAEQAEELRGKATWLEQRTSLARELHDVVGHHVTAMVVQAEAGQVGDAQEALQHIGELGRSALAELDAMVVHLRDPDSTVAVTAPPRLSDIDELLAAPLRGQGVDVQVRVDADLGLDELDVMTVYRIAQEGLTNVTRHARAEHAWVELTRTEERVRLRVSDDGVGPARIGERGSGLVGIDERVNARGGTWDLSVRPGGGTILDVVLPTGPG